MKRITVGLLILVCLSSLFGRPTLMVTSEGEGSSYTLVAGLLERVVPALLLSRIDGEGELSVFIGALEAEENSLSVDLLFSYEGKSLSVLLSAQAKDSTHLGEELERRLSSLLLYEGLALVEKREPLVVEYTHASGYATLVPLRKGEHYKGLDADGNRLATAVVQQVITDPSPLSLLAATSGKTLLPGMRLEKMGGKAVEFTISSSLAVWPSLGFDGAYTQDIGLYPFRLVAGGGFTFSGQPLSFSSLYGRFGFAVTLPLSMVGGIQGGFWRNSALAMECSVGLGFAPGQSALLYGSTATFTYRYHLEAYTLSLGVGNKYWASKASPFTSGLFIQLGLAYTW